MFAAHAQLLQHGVYAPAWQRYQGDHDLDAYIRGIAEHYATDPGYAPKILQLAHAPCGRRDSGGTPAEAEGSGIGR